ncbi:type 1 fimbrial protein [Scandinavium sp. H11S7]|uniref:Type 1 fimbrial protein n=1 Tax=Scandinavium hiltneri TaxID=2926519 RepID=A0ABT2E3M9_9ENTR|nr:fimbrial protein [Scandinavium hiltneri]MCS2162484.1 type 1 fimbrial protein [Scandinavium hiltneri]
MANKFKFKYGLLAGILAISGSAAAMDGTVTFKGSVLGSSTCGVDIASQNAAATVDVNDISLTDASALSVGDADSKDSATFTINLAGCTLPTGKTGVNVTLESGIYGDSTYNTYNNYLGQSGGSTASQGVGLAIGERGATTFTPIALDNSSAVSAFASSGTGPATTYTKDFSVRYVKVNPVVTTGLFETMMTFSVSYL